MDQRYIRLSAGQTKSKVRRNGLAASVLLIVGVTVSIQTYSHALSANRFLRMMPTASMMVALSVSSRGIPMVSVQRAGGQETIAAVIARCHTRFCFGRPWLHFETSGRLQKLCTHVTGPTPRVASSAIPANMYSRDKSNATNLEELEKLVGEANARRLLRVGGVKSRLRAGSIAKFVRRLRSEYSFSAEQIVTFMSSGIAARLDDEVIWKALDRLSEEFGIADKDLPAFMSNSLAARLDDEVIWKALKRLRDEFGIAGKDLPTFMSDSVAAARPDDEVFWKSLKRLRDEFGITGKELPIFMSDRVAAQLDDEAFWKFLKRLRDEFGIAGMDFPFFMKGTVLARLDDEAFWRSLKRLRDEFGITVKDLPTFMSGSVAAQLDDEAFWKSLKRLRDEFGITDNSLAARLDDEAFWHGDKEMDPKSILDAATKCVDFLGRMRVEKEWVKVIEGKERRYEIKEWRADDFSDEDRSCMVGMVEKDLKTFYEDAYGWNAEDKRLELFHPMSRFLVIRRKTDAGGEDWSIVGFLMFRFCWDDDDEPEFPVMYVYEVNVCASERGAGLGRKLMEVASRIQEESSLWKVMLTCFKKNTAALAFYKKVGFDIDVYSPSRCRWWETGFKCEILSNRPDASS